MRDLRIACVETFGTATSRLGDLNEFVEQQEARSRANGDDLFAHEQLLSRIKQRLSDLGTAHAACATNLQRARLEVERRALSYRTAAKLIPSGDVWAAAGSSALSELRKLIRTTSDKQWDNPQDWHAVRVKALQDGFQESLAGWRSARRAFEKAGFEIDLPSISAFKSIEEQLSAATKDMELLPGKINECQATLGAVKNDLLQWDETIQKLRLRERTARARLDDAMSAFHLADLKFTAWRLRQSSDNEAAFEALPNAVETKPVKVTDIYGTQGRDSDGESVLGPARQRAFPRSDSEPTSLSAGNTASEAPSSPQDTKADQAFREQAARFELAQARLRFVTDTWNRETEAVREASRRAEVTEFEAQGLTKKAGQLSANLESLRRGLQELMRSLSTHRETLGAVEKRFSADLEAIDGLLNTASQRTKSLEIQLEKEI